MPKSQYPHRFINQYARIPDQVSKRLEAEFGAEYEGVRHCLGLILTNLLAHGIVAYSRRGNFYTNNRTKHYTMANMMRAADIAEEKGYVSKKIGFRSAGYERGVSSSLIPRAKLWREFDRLKGVEMDVESLPLLTVDGRPAFDADDLVYIINKSVMPIPLLPTIYDATYKLNREYFNRMSIDYGNLRLEEPHLCVVGLTRVFKGGGVGRWFQKGGRSYQGLSKEERSMLLLNGEEVTELDYPAMHPHILYAWEGTQCPEDFYERVADLCGCTRSVAKSMVLLALNATSYASLSSAINLNKAQEAKANLVRKEPKPILYEELNEMGLRPMGVVDAISEAHPAIRKYLFSGVANRLMLEESEVMTSVLLRLMEMGIPSLPVHDSLIAPKRHREKVRQVMENSYREHTGFQITVV